MSGKKLGEEDLKGSEEFFKEDEKEEKEKCLKNPQKVQFYWKASISNS